MTLGSGLFQSSIPAKEHLVRDGGLGGEIADLRKDVIAALSPLAAIAVEEFTNPEATDVDGIKVAFATADAAQTFTGYALDGVLSEMDSAGTTPPAIYISRTAETTNSLRQVKIEITTLGSPGTAKFRLSVDGGLTWLVSGVTVPTTPFKYDVAGQNITLIFTNSAYASNNVYTFTGIVGGVVLDYPRNVTITTSNHAATWQQHVHVTGIGPDGASVTDSLALANNTTVVGTKLFSRILSILVDPQVDALGTISVGIGGVLGLSKAIKSRAGLVTALKEIAAGAVVTNGTFAASGTGIPNGTYAPNDAPDGTKDYAVYYEYTP
jgi:hypothetical protein